MFIQVKRPDASVCLDPDNSPAPMGPKEKNGTSVVISLRAQLSQIELLTAPNFAVITSFCSPIKTLSLTNVAEHILPLCAAASSICTEKKKKSAWLRAGSLSLSLPSSPRVHPVTVLPKYSRKLFCPEPILSLILGTLGRASLLLARQAARSSPSCHLHQPISGSQYAFYRSPCSSIQPSAPDFQPCLTVFTRVIQQIRQFVDMLSTCGLALIQGGLCSDVC